MCFVDRSLVLSGIAELVAPRGRRVRLDVGGPGISHYEHLPDFLPPPDQLAFREDEVKVTLALSKHSVAFFKAEAKKQALAALEIAPSFERAQELLLNAVGG